MRTIKFRAWLKNTKKPIFNFMEEYTLYALNSDVLIISQFTGLYDKNGIDEIYECDIIGIDGLKKGNVYETPTPQIYETGKILKQGIACVVKRMGTKEWRESEQELLGLGCQYSE